MIIILLLNEYPYAKGSCKDAVKLKWEHIKSKEKMGECENGRKGQQWPFLICLLLIYLLLSKKVVN